MTFPRHLLRLFAYALLVSVFIACSSGSDDAPSVSLSASPDAIALGQSSELSWTITSDDPATLSISPDVGINDLTSPVTVTPTETTTYTLTATNDGGSSSDSATITVVTSPTIFDFSASPTSGAAPLDVTFTWNVISPDSVSCTLTPDTNNATDTTTFDPCLGEQQSTVSYSSPGTYTSVLTLAGSDGSDAMTQSLTITVTEGTNGGGGTEEEVAVSGFVDEQSRNVIVILTGDEVAENGTSLNKLNAAIATAEASRGVVSNSPAIRGLNASVLGLLQTQQATPGALFGSEAARPLFNIAREFVLAVDSDGTVIDTSPLTRLDDDPEDTELGEQNRLQFDLDLPAEQNVALVIAQPDGQGGWLCRGELEYQLLEEQRTIRSEQAIFNLPEELAGNDEDERFGIGAFQFNELTANLASLTEENRSATTMLEDLPDEEIEDAIVPLEDAPEFSDGFYVFCGNENIARNDVSANIDWRSDIFNVTELPPQTSRDLEDGEEAVYDFSIAFLLESITEDDEEGNPVTFNRLLGTSPIDTNGNVNFNLVRNSLEDLDATLFFTDVAFFDAEKRRFPLTPSYQFDAVARDLAEEPEPEPQALSPDELPESEEINLGVVDGGLGYISGLVVTEEGVPVADANVIIVLDGERLAFNVATSDEDGFYELLIPSDTDNKYILYAQNAEGTVGGIASNDDTGVRYEVLGSRIFDQNIVLDVPLEEDGTGGGTPVVSGGGNRQIRLGSTLNLEGDVSFVDPLPEDDEQRSVNAGRASSQDLAELILRWQILEAPEGSTAELTSTDTLATSFTPDVVGRYSLRFSVFDGETLTADVITVDVFGNPDNTVLFLTPEDFDPILGRPIPLIEGQTVELTLERLGTTRNSLTVQLALGEQSTLTADELILTGATANNGSFEVTFPERRSRVEFTLTVAENALDDDNFTEIFTLELAETFTYNLADPSTLRFEVSQRPQVPETPPGLQTPPPPGKDIIVFNDTNLFLDDSIIQEDNITLIKNLVSFPSVDSPRDNSSVVAFDRGRNSVCGGLFGLNGCSDEVLTVMRGIIEDEGYTIRELDSSSGTLVDIASDIRVLFLWNPLVAYTGEEINALKSFADEGGRIVFVGEHEDYYGLLGFSIQNQLLLNMGAVLENVGGFFDCLGVTISSSSIRTSQITNQVDSLRISCASAIELGPNDYALFFDSTNTIVLAGVATIDTTPVTVTDPTDPTDPIDPTDPTPPSITSFTAEPSSIEAGESSILSWTVNSELPVTLTITPNVGDVSGQSSVEVSPTETTTYTLTAENADGVVTAETTIPVTDPPEPELQVCEGNIDVISQPQVDALANCSEITGILRIQDNPFRTPITSLEPLSNLTSIGEVELNSSLDRLQEGFGLLISSNPELTSLAGLENLRSVAGSVVIYNSDGLTNFEGLNGLETIGRSFVVGDNFTVSNRGDQGNEFLLSFEGLDSLASIGESFIIWDNSALQSLRGLTSLQTIEGSLDVRNNDALEEIAGLTDLESVGGDLGMYGNNSFRSFAGLDVLRSVGGLAFENDSLTNLQGLNNLETIRGNLHVGGKASDDTFASAFDGSAITSLEGLDNLRSIEGNFWVWDNPSLQQIRSLSNLESVGGNVLIGNSTTLTTIEGFDSLTRIGGYLSIDGGANVSFPELFSSLVIFSMPNLETVGGFFRLQQTTSSLMDFDLTGLTTINGGTSVGNHSIEMFNNNALQSLDGLANVRSIAGNIEIQSHSSLTDISGLQGIVNFPDSISVDFFSTSITREDCDALPFPVDFCF